jgi:hypothetical protein
MNAMAYACGAMGREIESRRGIEGSFKKISMLLCNHFCTHFWPHSYDYQIYNCVQRQRC